MSDLEFPLSGKADIRLILIDRAANDSKRSFLATLFVFLCVKKLGNGNGKKIVGPLGA